MKKKIIAILIILNLILVGGIYNLINKENVNNKKQIIKEMTESEYDNNITSLNTSHEDYATYIQNCKTSIATALTNEGIPTSNEEKLEIMADKISNIFTERTKLDSTIAATANDILEGKNAWVNGNLITGTLKATTSANVVNSLVANQGSVSSLANYTATYDTIVFATLTITQTSLEDGWFSYGLIDTTTGETKASVFAYIGVGSSRQSVSTGTFMLPAGHTLSLVMTGGIDQAPWSHGVGCSASATIMEAKY